MTAEAEATTTESIKNIVSKNNGKIHTEIPRTTLIFNLWIEKLTVSGTLIAVIKYCQKILSNNKPFFGPTQCSHGNLRICKLFIYCIHFLSIGQTIIFLCD